jgi:hypothetical protein
MSDEPKKPYIGREKGLTKNKLQGAIQDKPLIVGSGRKVDENRQKQSRTEFLKVRDGETLEEWEKRTQGRRILGKKQPVYIRKVPKTRVYTSPRKQPPKQRANNKKILFRFIEKPQDFLNIYPIVIRWASIRHNILKDDLELGYYFYNGAPFTAKRFNELCVQLGAVRGVFARFKKKGYISVISVVDKKKDAIDTDFYLLSSSFVVVIKNIYEQLSRINKIKIDLDWRDAKKNYIEPHPKMRELLEQMNTEIEEIQNGIKQTQEIRYNPDVDGETFSKRDL